MDLEPTIVLALGIQLAVFLVWAFAMYRMLFRLFDRVAKRAAAENTWPHPRIQLAVLREAWAEPGLRREWWRLLVLTVLLLILAVFAARILPGV